jgi:hypothetical protein
MLGAMARTGRGAKVALIAVAGFGDARRRDERQSLPRAEARGGRPEGGGGGGLQRPEREQARRGGTGGLPRQGRASLDGGDDPSRGLFTKRERRPPCPTAGDQDAIAADVAAYAAALDAVVGSAVRPSRCDAAKLGCVSWYVSGAFTCLARAAKGTGVMVRRRCAPLSISKSRNQSQRDL